MSLITEPKPGRPEGASCKYYEPVERLAACRVQGIVFITMNVTACGKVCG